MLLGLVPSTRFTLALVCFFGCLVTYSLRTNMSFAIVCMAIENKTTEVVEGAVSKCGKEIVVSSSASDVSVLLFYSRIAILSGVLF